MLFSGSPYLLARAIFTLRDSVPSKGEPDACMSESYSEIAKLYDAMRVRNSLGSASVNSHIKSSISVKRSSEVTVSISSNELVSDNLWSADFLSLSPQDEQNTESASIAEPQYLQ